MPPISVHKWNTCLCTTPLDCAVHHLAFTLLCKPGGIQKWVYSVYICVGGGGWISSKWECYTGFLHVLHCVVQIQLMLMGSDHLIQADPEIWKWKVKKFQYLITPSLGLFFLTFFLKKCEHMSIFGATDALFQIYGFTARVVFLIFTLVEVYVIYVSQDSPLMQHLWSDISLPYFCGTGEGSCPLVLGPKVI